MAGLKDDINLKIDLGKKDIKASFEDIRTYYLAKNTETSTPLDNFHALALAVRHRIVARWMKTQTAYHHQNKRRVYYLSMEFLIGRLLGNYMFNLGKEKDIETAMAEFGINLEELREQELDAGLGNGGLGRLAACFLDSMATLGIPAHGYGIRYDYGIFNQKMKEGWQVELPDEWMRNGNPWELPRPEYQVKVDFYGQIDTNARGGARWVGAESVLAMPYDTPIPGYKNDVVNTLRLWSARANAEFDFDYFNHGDYEHAVQKKISSESISKVLYPNDNVSQGKELRLKQEHFFTAASIADILRRYKSDNQDLHKLYEKVCIQLNDTHPTLAVVELMRVLMDKEGLNWEEAWAVTGRTFAYTNHTLMPEALECWNVELMRRVLPRHLEIIFEMNGRFLDEVSRKFPGDTERLRRLSIIQEGDQKRIRMAHIAIVGSFSINGVSALHTDLLKAQLFHDFYQMYPERFNNKTNGITPRRWLLKANPKLSELITETIGDKWVTDLGQLERLTEQKDNPEFLQRWRAIKQGNKNVLADHILKTMNIAVNRNSLFDVQVKRIHEYKRQFLFGLYVMAQYLRVKNSPHLFVQPRTFIIGGKAAPGYHLAKLTIKFINSVGNLLDQDRAVRDKLQLLFLANYRVSLAEKIIPAADLSEQISTAGMEASGTGNMKFMLNGALTVGTYDGANIEMAQSLGGKDIFIFGLKADEVLSMRAKGYNPREFIKKSPELSEILRLIERDTLSPEQPGLFEPLLNTLYQGDFFMLCADFEAYCRAQDDVSKLYQDQTAWTRASIINVAKAGPFSSDRTIREYARDIWKVPTSS